MTNEKDPWADLAESLGATPGSDPKPQQASEPSRPRPPQQVPRSRPRPAVGGDWDGLASDLGIEGRGALNAPPRTAHEPTHERPPLEREAPRDSTVEVRRDLSDDAGWAEGIVAEAGREAGRQTRERVDSSDSQDGRERQGRRRRGRRGGRGRRDASRAETGPARDREERRTISGDETTDFGHRREPDDAERHAEDAPAGNSSNERQLQSGDAEEGDGDRPRRRRRGRRGGRRRGRGTRERLAGERTIAEKPESEHRLEEFEDEPLATGYGATPRPITSSRTEPGHTEQEHSAKSVEGERRGRRRRRGSDDSRSAAPRRDSKRESGRRRVDDSSRSGNRSDRGRRRDDFAPVAGRFDEDDEGLEFLGVEEAGRTPQGRDRRPTPEDESIAESGLDTVREVPSWVEAIGIVIAANLDARDKSSGGRK
jgi:hypothetical protein